MTHKERCALLENAIDAIQGETMQLRDALRAYKRSLTIETERVVFDGFQRIGVSVANMLFLLTAMDEGEDG